MISHGKKIFDAVSHHQISTYGVFHKKLGCVENFFEKKVKKYLTSTLSLLYFCVVVVVQLILLEVVMLVQVTRSCGHQEWVRSNAPLRERDAVIARESRKLCAECYAAQRATQAQQAAQAQSLPQLTGSDKQIAWASDIRQQMLTATADLRRQAQEAVEHPERDPHGTAPVVLAVLDEIVSTHTEARWWIDNRNADWVQLVFAAAKQRIAQQ